MDSLPRVPDTHGDTVDEKVFSDLYIRTSWFDAAIALDQIEKVGRVFFVSIFGKFNRAFDGWQVNQNILCTIYEPQT